MESNKETEYNTYLDNHFVFKFMWRCRYIW